MPASGFSTSYAQNHIDTAVSCLYLLRYILCAVRGNDLYGNIVMIV